MNENLSPEQFTFQHQEGRKGNAVVAFHGQDRVGSLSYRHPVEVWGGTRQEDGSIESHLTKRPPVIMRVDVSRNYRRKGIATGMLDLAKQHAPDIQHDDALSEDGQAWAKARPL